MTSAISAIGMGLPIPTLSAPTDVAGVSGAAEVSAPAPVGDRGFADVLAGAVDQLNGVQGNADALATQAATGDLQDAHDYMIASSEAKLATETVVSLKNSAVAAFTEIMRMQL
jgi:flagellar hook-basal body complex protein FliE